MGDGYSFSVWIWWGTHFIHSTFYAIERSCGGDMIPAFKDQNGWEITYLGKSKRTSPKKWWLSQDLRDEQRSTKKSIWGSQAVFADALQQEANMTNSKPEGHCSWRRKSSGKHNEQGEFEETDGGQTSPGFANPVKKLSLHPTQSETSEGIYTGWQHYRIYSLRRLSCLLCKE